MSTATSATVALDQTRYIIRQRREHEEQVTDCQNTLALQQQKITTLLGQLTDAANDGAEAQLLRERAELKSLATELQKARSELSAFSEQHPSDKQIQAKERDLARQIDEDDYRSTQKAFAMNMFRRFELFDQLKALEEEAAGLYERARKQWPYAEGKRHGHAGITPDLIAFMPIGFFPVPVAFGSAVVNGQLLTLKRKADQWLAKWNLTTERGEQ